MQTQLPAGLVDNNIEVFDNNKGRATVTYKGRIIDFRKLPRHMYNFFHKQMIADVEKYKVLSEHFRTEEEKLNQYLLCLYGGFDNIPDYDYTTLHTDNWACKRRGECPFGHKLCPKLTTKTGEELSRREIEIIQLFATGLSVKEVADELNISDHTARTHSQNIHRKLGLNKTTEVVRFAFKHNLNA